MKKFVCFIISITGTLTYCFSQSVTLVYSKTSTQQAYAAGILEQTVSKRGYSIKETGADYLVSFVIDKKTGQRSLFDTTCF